MSFRRILAIAGPLGLLVAAACQAPYVTMDQYTRDIDANKEYIAQLEHKLSELEGVKRAYDYLKEDSTAGKSLLDMESELAQQLKKTLDGLKVEKGDVYQDPRTGAWVLSESLLFESGSYRITARGTEVLKKIAQAYQDPAHTFRIVGHTDRDPVVRVSTKNALPVSDTNTELSALRATAVMADLMKTGIPEQRMFVEGRGNSQPMATNDRNPENKRKNRRVEIFVLKN